MYSNRLLLISGLLLFVLATISCSTDEVLREEVQSLRQEVDLLRQELNQIPAESVELAARAILGEWSRDVPQKERVGNNYEALRASVFDPDVGAAAQLNRALVRVANAAAVIFLLEEMTGQPEARQLEVLNQCLEYLLATTSSTRSCNLIPIAP